MEPAASSLDMAAVGRRVRNLRRRKNLSLEGLGNLAGISFSMLSAVERGQKVPSILVMGQIATALGTSIGRLVDEERPPRVVVLRAADQLVIKDPIGMERR